MRLRLRLRLLVCLCVCVRVCARVRGSCAPLTPQPLVFGQYFSWFYSTQVPIFYTLLMCISLFQVFPFEILECRDRGLGSRV
jgi:hypothetical protein